VIYRDGIVAEIERELDDLMVGAPENVSGTTLKSIREESIECVHRTLNSISSKELESPLALERFIETTVAYARLKMHMR
jgi:hypothetical protein